MLSAFVLTYMVLQFLICMGKLICTKYLFCVFQVQDLAVASPATVSRCGMVYVDPDELKWMPYVRTWISGLGAKVVLADIIYVIPKSLIKLPGFAEKLFRFFLRS